MKKNLQELKNELSEMEYSKALEIKTTGFVSGRTFNKIVKLQNLIESQEEAIKCSK